MDLNKIVAESMVSIQVDGYVESVVKKRLQETIKSVVDDLFGGYGDFRKKIEAEIKEQLHIDFKNLGVAGYNLMILNEVKSQLDRALHVNGVEKIKENMEKMMSGVKPEYLLSELIEAMKKDENEDGEKDGEQISFILERSDYGFVHIYIDPDGDKERKYSYRYSIDLDKEGRVYNAKIDDHDLSKNNDIMKRFYNFDKLMFQIFASGAKIIVDEDEVDTYYGDNY